MSEVGVKKAVEKIISLSKSKSQWEEEYERLQKLWEVPIRASDKTGPDAFVPEKWIGINGKLRLQEKWIRVHNNKHVVPSHKYRITPAISRDRKYIGTLCAACECKAIHSARMTCADAQTRIEKQNAKPFFSACSSVFGDWHRPEGSLLYSKTFTTTSCDFLKAQEEKRAKGKVGQYVSPVCEAVLARQKPSTSRMQFALRIPESLEEKIAAGRHTYNGPAAHSGCSGTQYPYTAKARRCGCSVPPVASKLGQTKHGWRDVGYTGKGSEQQVRQQYIGKGSDEQKELLSELSTQQSPWSCTLHGHQGEGLNRHKNKVTAEFGSLNSILHKYRRLPKQLLLRIIPYETMLSCFNVSTHDGFRTPKGGLNLFAPSLSNMTLSMYPAVHITDWKYTRQAYEAKLQERREELRAATLANDVATPPEGTIATSRGGLTWCAEKECWVRAAKQHFVSGLPVGTKGRSPKNKKRVAATCPKCAAPIDRVCKNCKHLLAQDAVTCLKCAALVTDCKYCKHPLSHGVATISGINGGETVRIHCFTPLVEGDTVVGSLHSSGKPVTPWGTQKKPEYYQRFFELVPGFNHAQKLDWFTLLLNWNYEDSDRDLRKLDRLCELSDILAEAGRKFLSFTGEDVNYPQRPFGQFVLAEPYVTHKDKADSKQPERESVWCLMRKAGSERAVIEIGPKSLFDERPSPSQLRTYCSNRARKTSPTTGIKVRKGGTLRSVADKFNTTPKLLREWNGIPSNIGEDEVLDEFGMSVLYLHNEDWRRWTALEYALCMCESATPKWREIGKLTLSPKPEQLADAESDTLCAAKRSRGNDEEYWNSAKELATVQLETLIPWDKPDLE